MHANFFFAAVFNAALAMASSPNKPPMRPYLNYDLLERGYHDALPPVASHWDYWPTEWMPQGCKDIAHMQNLDPKDFTVFDVTYKDCPESWSFCRHKDAIPTEVEMMNMLGRAPIHMRSGARHVMAIPSRGLGFVAFIYNNGDLVFEDKITISTVIHELSHSLDWHGRDDRPSPFSNTSDWQNEYAKDSNSVREYANTNWLENFAVASEVAVFDKIVKNGLKGIARNWKQVLHQYTTYQGWFDQYIHPGGTCNKRFENTQAVRKSNKGVSARFSSEVMSKPDVSFKSNDLHIFKPKETLDVVACNKQG